MAATTITDNGASIKLTIGTQVRNIIKAQIIEISVIKTNIVKIDIGQGALHNIFIPFGDVTAPLTSDPEALRDAINGFLTPASMGVTASEAKQVEQIDILNSLKAYLLSLQTLVTDLDSKIFHDPLLVDDSGPNILYNGYAVVGTDQEAPAWAIERIEQKGEIHIHTWADGNKNFDNSWIARESLVYS